ncbi:MAG: hypothetical protein MJZ13_07200 [Bacteroidales bacterium]|nr:hypothetical protein [Bacteroidales bacterium]
MKKIMFSLVAVFGFSCAVSASQPSTITETQVAKQFHPVKLRTDDNSLQTTEKSQTQQSTVTPAPDKDAFTLIASKVISTSTTQKTPQKSTTQSNVKKK